MLAIHFYSFICIIAGRELRGLWYFYARPTQPSTRNNTGVPQSFFIDAKFLPGTELYLRLWLMEYYFQPDWLRYSYF